MNYKQIMCKVYLIGAGPGDPELLTIKAKNILEKCDVVLYDFFVSDVILNYAPTKCEKICVGKQKGNHLKTQKEINQLLRKLSKKFKIIARLKAGTPFLFGKGFEEAQFLQKNNIDFEVIPGVSSATAVPESFLIPLTYTKEFSSIAFVSGHFTDIDKIQAPNADTLVYFMGLFNIEKIIEKLFILGRDKKTPCAILSRGTFSDAKIIRGNLDNILEKLNNQKINSPAMFFVGSILNK